MSAFIILGIFKERNILKMVVDSQVSLYRPKRKKKQTDSSPQQSEEKLTVIMLRFLHYSALHIHYDGFSSIFPF